MPSIKATLSDREFDLITSIAGDNFKEEQQVPQGALWLEQHHTKAEDGDQGEEGGENGPEMRYVILAEKRLPKH